jgi:hypothetical protein
MWWKVGSAHQGVEKRTSLRSSGGTLHIIVRSALLAREEDEGYRPQDIAREALAPNDGPAS